MALGRPGDPASRWRSWSAQNCSLRWRASSRCPPGLVGRCGVAGSQRVHSDQQSIGRSDPGGSATSARNWSNQGTGAGSRAAAWAVCCSSRAGWASGSSARNSRAARRRTSSPRSAAGGRSRADPGRRRWTAAGTGRPARASARSPPPARRHHASGPAGAADRCGTDRRRCARLPRRGHRTGPHARPRRPGSPGPATVPGRPAAGSGSSHWMRVSSLTSGGLTGDSS